MSTTTKAIRRWIIENDLLEGIVAMPDQLFYNTGISTYVWIILRKSLGNKRHEFSQQESCKTKIGYEIPITRHFYKYTPLRPSHEPDADLRDNEIVPLKEDNKLALTKHSMIRYIAPKGAVLAKIIVQIRFSYCYLTE